MFMFMFMHVQSRAECARNCGLGVCVRVHVSNIRQNCILEFEMNMVLEAKLPWRAMKCLRNDKRGVNCRPPCGRLL